MRAFALAGLVLCAACATSVHELPGDRSPDPKQALVAGSLAFDVLHLRKQPDGGCYDVRPGHETFLVQLPAGNYVVTGFGPYEPTNDRLTIELRAGGAHYVGNFERARDDNGNLKVAVYDDLGRAQADLEKRLGKRAPTLQRSIVRSSLEPLGDKFIVDVQRPYHDSYYSLGFHYGYFGYGYGYYGHYGHHGHHH